jgi:hypothetical protein
MRKRSTPDSWFFVLLGSSLIVALAALLAPARERPIHFRTVLQLSVPLAVIWLTTTFVYFFRFRWRGLWILIGAPFALYWPVWLIFNRIPACFWRGNCF